MQWKTKIYAILYEYKNIPDDANDEEESSKRDQMFKLMFLYVKQWRWTQHLTQFSKIFGSIDDEMSGESSENIASYRKHTGGDHSSHVRS